MEETLHLLLTLTTSLPTLGGGAALFCYSNRAYGGSVRLVRNAE